MAPNSPGHRSRLVLYLLLLLLLSLMIFSVWNYYHGQHYRYVSVKSISSPSDQDLSSHSYGIIIDAGSSGSKVHLFHWPPHNGDPHKLLDIHPLKNELGDPLTKKVEPGIATFASTPQAAFNSLIPLLEFASSHIPTKKHSHTVLYVLGTAGMRFLLAEDQERVITHLNTALPQEYPFHLPQDGIQIITGQLEGVFSWITINYLLGHFSPESHTHQTAEDGQTDEYIHTVGVMDMGGASLQIAFEISQQVEFSSENVVEINLGCGAHDNQHKHRVYSRTYLGYGSNTARSKYYNSLLRQRLKNSTYNRTISEPASHHPTLKDPCTQRGLLDNVTLDNKQWMRVRGIGDFYSCKKTLSPLLKDGRGTQAAGISGEGRRGCVSRDCGEGEAPFERPPEYLGYASMGFYGTSEFWYTMRDVLRMGGAYSSGEFEKKSADFCQTEWRLVSDRYSKQLYTYADLYRLRSQCLKSAWLSLILHQGLEFSTDSVSLRTTSSIGGQSVQWPLGALLYFTRYLPLREVQIQKQNHLKSTQQSHLTHSSFVPPLLVVFFVIFLLLLCRHRRKSTGTLLLSPGSNFRLPRSISHASGLRAQRRTSSVSNPVLPRNQSSAKLAWIV